MDPDIIMNVIVALIVLAVGIFAFFIESTSVMSKAVFGENNTKYPNNHAIKLVNHAPKRNIQCNS